MSYVRARLALTAVCTGALLALAGATGAAVGAGVVVVSGWIFDVLPGTEEEFERRAAAYQELARRITSGRTSPAAATAITPERSAASAGRYAANGVSSDNVASGPKSKPR